MIVDFFPFFAPYGEQLLELRVNLLKDHVDYFVIAESNKTHSGQPVERKFPEIAKKLGLPEDKIIYIEHDIPDDENLEVLPIDVLNTYENYEWSLNSEKIESLRARVRERLQKDSLLLALDEFDDDTVFIHSDSDEIIKPDTINYLAKVCRENQNEFILKIPLVYCEARADLRVYNKNSNTPADWSGGMFLATKRQLLKATPTQIRSNNENPFPIRYTYENGKRDEDLGWHFSWMGGKDMIQLKSKSWAHYNDNFSFNDFESFSEKSYENFVQNNTFEEGTIPPSGNNNYVLKKYPLEHLPKMILSNNRLREFFLPGIRTEDLDVMSKATLDPSYLINNYDKMIWVADNFYNNPDEVRAYALTREFEEGGFGRGYIGRRTPKQYLFPGLKEAFEEIMGKKITRWKEYGMNGRFQSCWAGEPLVYHCDSQKYAGMLYLTPNAPFETGTTMYAHKSNRVRHNSHPEIMSCFHGNNLDGTHYEPVDVVGNVYNRLVIFDAGMLHAASEYFGYDLETSRLWQMFFFDAE